MSKSHRELHPLLCDEYSDEEVHTSSPKYHKRYSTSSGRARAQVKGAAAILNRWPGMFFNYYFFLLISI